jgi:hypothetical protein
MHRIPSQRQSDQAMRTPLGQAASGNGSPQIAQTVLWFESDMLGAPRSQGLLGNLPYN